MVTAVVRAQRMLERAWAFVGAIIVMALMFLMTAEVVGRYVFTHPIPGSFEISEFMLVGIVFLASAYVQSLRGHVKLGMLGRRLSKKGKTVLDLFGHAVGLFALSLITWQAGLLAWMAWYTHDYARGLLRMPLWPPKAVLTLGVGLLCTRLILDIVHDILRLKGVTNEP